MRLPHIRSRNGAPTSGSQKDATGKPNLAADGKIHAVPLVLIAVLLLGGLASGVESPIGGARFFPVEYPGAKPSSCVLCRKAAAPPTIDGRLDDPAWTNALVVRDFYLLGGGRLVRATVKTEARFLYAAAHLYVGVTCYDSRAQQLPVPARSTVRDKGVKWGNSVELFLGP